MQRTLSSVPTSCTLACPVSRCLVQPSPAYSHSSPAQRLLYLLPQRFPRGYSRCLVSQTCLLDQTVASLQGAPSQSAALMVTRPSPPRPLFQYAFSCEVLCLNLVSFLCSCLNELPPLIHARPLPRAGRQRYLASQTSRTWLALWTQKTC